MTTERAWRPSPEGASVDLCDLPAFSPWPARLLSAGDWRRPDRTRERVFSEYDGDKYKSCLEAYEGAGGQWSLDEVKQWELRAEDEREAVVSFGDELCRLPLWRAYQIHREIICRNVLAWSSNATHIIELGAGYGANLGLMGDLSPEARVLGGEFSPAAVTLARRLREAGGDCDVAQFDFYDRESYDLLNQPDATGVVVFTAHALEQLPTARPFLESVALAKRELTIVHMEPTPEVCSGDLLGLMRAAYARANDYLSDLHASLGELPGAELICVDKTIFGLNPLNPTTLTVWRWSGAR